MRLGTGTRQKVLWTAILIALGIASPVTAQSSFVADMLRAITAHIEIENSATGQSALCHGFVDTVRYNVAYLVTAKHCVEDLNSTKLSPTTVDPSLTVSVTYSNGTAGTLRRLFWNTGLDALVVAAAFLSPPLSFAGECPGCRAHTVFAGQRTPVLSVLSAGGGPPVVSSGFLFSDQFGRYFVALPSSAGTSGSAVLDLQGNLVGIVVAGLVNRSAEAGWITDIVPGGVIFNLVGYAVKQMEESSPPGSFSPPSPPGPRPALASGLGGTWVGTWRSSRMNGGSGQFSAEITQDGLQVHGTVTFGGMGCFDSLQVSGSTSGDNQYTLVAKSDDGISRMQIIVSVSYGTLSGDYNALLSGSACDVEWGRLDATYH